LADILGLGGIVGGIISAVNMLFSFLRDFGVKIIDIGKEILVWLFSEVASRPEVGVTLLAIIFYLLSPYTI